MSRSDTRCRVILIDDAADLRTLVTRLLNRDGRFEVVAEAGDGRAGVEAVREQQPDAVLLDLAMPEMDGLQALPLIRKACPAAKVVILTGFDQEQLSDDDVYVDADGFLEKGAAFDHVCSTLARVCEVTPH